MQRIFLTAISALALVSTSLKAEILLTVDVSNPNSVVFTATNGAPNTSVDVDAFVGFSLLGFLNTDALEVFDGNGNLAANGMTDSYLTFFSLDYATGPSSPGKDVNLFANLDAGTQNFVTSAPAFSGSITFDLSSISLLLPTIGTTGSIQVGDGITVGPVIGTYEVVPEPAACFLLGAAGMLLIFRRRRVY